MATTAGYVFTISVATTKAGTYNELKSKTGSFSRSSDVLDDTNTSNVGFHTRLQGLLDSACSTEVVWESGDTAIDRIESAMENRSELWVKILPDGVSGNGKKFQCVVENINMDLDVSTSVPISYSLQGTGAIFADDAS